VTASRSKGEQTRQRVLDAARDLFGNHGYDGTSLQMIADEMGVAKAAVYYYFPTKAAILGALVDAALVEVRAAFAGVEGGTTELRAARLVEAWVDVFLPKIVQGGPPGSMRFDDPDVRREIDLLSRVREIEAVGLRNVFGEAPTPDQVLAFHLLMQLPKSAAWMLPFDEAQMRDLLVRTGLRVLGLHAPLGSRP
jgi:AcrR family transcriptional regulator